MVRTMELEDKLNLIRQSLSNGIEKAVKLEEYCSGETMSDIINILERPHNQVFTIQEINKLQSKVYEITGPGEIMALFNELLGIGAG